MRDEVEKKLSEYFEGTNHNQDMIEELIKRGKLIDENQSLKRLK